MPRSALSLLRRRPLGQEPVVPFTFRSFGLRTPLSPLHEFQSACFRPRDRFGTIRLGGNDRSTARHLTMIPRPRDI
ncbi:MAG: hypothetical protein BJ554DRAFT_7801 [Olpidium bornovanus]|uniref:Uncharacterized protein n=1 Tax=Olpidium bornovanus TaxID=278681 RepID=A0A8H7ZV29_9FUNG|nr:MAG: hypothetical protein BJ554DRAFT_7801 [Olpidium bornovanus]